MKHSFFPATSSSKKSYYFTGGIKPPANKKRSLRSVIMDTPIPEFLYLSLKQYSGPDAIPVVCVGDKVLKGQLLANAEGELGVPIHASTSGTIREITNRIIPDEFGHEAGSICIEADGQDTWITRQPITDFKSLGPELLREKIQLAGICGLGGAGFPTGKKFSSNKPIDWLIINGAECEPYITCDQALIREHPETIVSGARILQRICRALHCVIVIEQDKQDAIDALGTAIHDCEIELISVPAKYPSGSERQLIQMLTNQEVPSGKLPQDIGVLTANAGTASAVHNAVINNEPLISRITTVCGDALKTPKNFRALIGTPVSFLLELCGIDYTSLSRLIVGGSLRGFTLKNLDAPIINTTNCLIAGSLREFPPAPAELACIRCGSCTDACPAGLMPQLLYDQIRSNESAKAKQYGLNDCIECGACAYVCPSHIPLVQYYRAAKSDLAAQKLRQRLSAKWQQRFEVRQTRIRLNEKRKKGSRRRSLSRPEGMDVTDTSLENFSRENAKQQIADAVARVKARKDRTPTNTQVKTKNPGEGKP